MANNTADTTDTAPGSAPDAAVSALVAAVQTFTATMSGDVPFGAAGTVLERLRAVREQIDQLTFAMLAPLAQMEASGALLAEGGQNTLKAYLAHAWGIGHTEAERLMGLAQNLHRQSLPETAAAIEAGALTVGEAAAIAAGVEREVGKRDPGTEPDAVLYRATLDRGLAGMKADRPAMSVKSLGDMARALGVTLVPGRAEKNEEAAFAARGARLVTTFGGSFTFEAWGPASDGQRLKAALASFTAPHTTTAGGSTTGTSGSGAGAGEATGVGLIPAGDTVASRYARTYDAFMSAAGFAHSHHDHTTTGGDTTGGETTGGETTGGETTGGGEAVGTGGGGCGQPPGTKAVINITVPLSALAAFGFTLNNTTTEPAGTDKANGPVEATGTADAAGAATAGGATDGGTSGAAGTVAAPGPEPGSGTEPSTGPPTTTNTTTGTGDPPGSAGLDPSADIAVTEDGHVLALSAVRAMAPTAQIRRSIFDDRTGLPLDLGRAHRLAPGYLRTAAFIGHTTCAWSGGCDVPVSQCEADHITEFSRGGETTAANLQPLCSLHNRLKYRRTKKQHTHTPAEDDGDTDPG